MPSAQPRIRTWAYTVQNLTDNDFICVENYDESQIDWCVVAAEKGEQNLQNHFQCAVRFKNGKSFAAAQAFLGLKPGDELASMRSAEFTNAAYCLKGDQPRAEWETEGVDGPSYGLNVNVIRQVGTLPQRGKSAKTSAWDDILSAVQDGWTDLEIMSKWPSQAIRCQSAIAQLRLKIERQNQSWRNLDVRYITGATGDGKTRFVMETHGYENVYRVQNYDSGAFDMYDGEDVVVFEEFRSGFKIQQMLNFLDGYPCQLPARYANKMAKFTKVYIVTNWGFDEQYKSVQVNYPSTYAAFERRIHAQGAVSHNQDGNPCMVFIHASGEITEERLPWLEDQESE